MRADSISTEIWKPHSFLFGESADAVIKFVQPAQTQERPKGWSSDLIRPTAYMVISHKLILTMDLKRSRQPLECILDKTVFQPLSGFTEQKV